jgi:N-acetyl-beta-hexosaminidase
VLVLLRSDVPGHTGGWLPLVESAGLQFCGSFPEHEERPQLFNDPKNKTLQIVTAVLHEMHTLFIDEYFNIGSDETFAYENAVGPNCTISGT